jgi:hypothetical protein
VRSASQGSVFSSTPVFFYSDNWSQKKSGYRVLQLKARAGQFDEVEIVVL